MTDCLTGCEIKPESDPRQLRIHVFALPGPHRRFRAS